MGAQMEMNWYLVAKQEPQQLQLFDKEELEMKGIEVVEDRYVMKKDGVRIYPVDAVLPLFIHGNCVGLAYIEEVSHRTNIGEPLTIIVFRKIKEFKPENPIALHYEDMYNAFKEKGRQIAAGKKFGPDNYRHLLNKRDFESVLEKINYDKKVEE